MSEILTRFLIGGAVVSAFAALGDMFKPKSFAGLFGAAPSVALASLGLAILHHGKAYAATEARSMIAGAIAFMAYAMCTSYVIMRFRARALPLTLMLVPLWLGIAVGLGLIGV